MQIEYKYRNLSKVGYPFNPFKPPVIFYINDRSKVVLLILFSQLLCVCLFWCQLLYCFHDDIYLGLGS